MTNAMHHLTAFSPEWHLLNAPEILLGCPHSHDSILSLALKLSAIPFSPLYSEQTGVRSKHTWLEPRTKHRKCVF